MNHTERLAETARRHRHLTRRVVRDAVETYFELLAEEIASGEWVEVPGIARIRILIEPSSGVLKTIGGTETHAVKQRLRTQFRLLDSFKQDCYQRGERG